MFAPHSPASSYRLQLTAALTFRDAEALVPYLADLGVTECYASPFLKASRGSQHGYDICDHNTINPELGTPEEFDALVQTLAKHGLGLILDFVPNHMGLDPAANAWWRDVLENGRSSPFADYFDIDWHPVTPELRNRILLPILEDQYGVVLERGDLQLTFEGGQLALQYLGRPLPIEPRSASLVYRTALNRLPPGTPAAIELAEAVSLLERLPSARHHLARRRAERRRAGALIKERLAALIAANPDVEQEVRAAVATINGIPGHAPTFNRLDALLDAQPYRLAHWKTALDQINYRRFFDINDLGGLRVEEPRVFDNMHALVLRLVRTRRISGLRIDHVDGLLDPAEYLARLQRAAANAVADPSPDRQPLYIVVEKILTGAEALPDWPVAGTTGYDFLNAVNGLFVDGGNEGAMARVYAQTTGRAEEFAEVAAGCKRLISSSSMSSELNVLAHQLQRIAASGRRTRDFTLNTLRRALIETVADFPVYRSYVTARGFSARDRETIDFAIDNARRRNRVIPPSVFLFLRSVLLAEPQPEDDFSAGASLADRRAFAMKFQQYTAPVQAKGVEDTAFYRYNPLVSLNEVGGNAALAGTTVPAFHAANELRLERHPLAMITTSTHDTKRGEDARARIDVISEIPQLWRRSVTGWMRINAPHRTAVDRKPAPDPNDEYLFYQSLVGAWPAELPAEPIATAAPPDLVERMRAYMQKAIKESKLHTSWINQNPAYEDAVDQFVTTSLTGPGGEVFLNAFVPLARRLARAGMVNALAALTLKIASPGVADFYQGAETWRLDFADPDNRRPVDFSARKAMFEELRPLVESAEKVASSIACACQERTALEAQVADAVARWPDGRIKMILTASGLRLRARSRELFLRGSYARLDAHGEHAAHIVGLARTLHGEALIAVVPRLTNHVDAVPTGDAVWRDTVIAVPGEFEGRPFTNVVTGALVRPATNGSRVVVGAGELFRTCPFALLWSGDQQMR